MSSAPGFRGDPSRANPEQLFVAALSACQALTYLFLAAKNGIRVAGYTDDAGGRLGVVDGRMRMARVTLRRNRIIGNSVSTPVEVAPQLAFTGDAVAAR